MKISKKYALMTVGVFALVGLSQIALNHPTALPSTATVKMRRNQSQLLFGAGGASGRGGRKGDRDQATERDSLVYEQDWLGDDDVAPGVLD